MRAATLLLVSCLVSCLAGSGAAAQDDAAWAGYLVEVTYAYRQDPPQKLVEKRAEIEAALAAMTQRPGDTDGPGAADDPDHPDHKERVRLEASLERVTANIEKDTGSIVIGWACQVNDEGLRIDGRTSMAGFFLPAGRSNNEIAAALEPGHCILVPRRGLKDIHTSGGRRYRETRRVKAFERPGWYEAPVRISPPLEVDAESTKHAETTVKFQHVKERESGRLYRFSMRTNVVDAPAGKDHAVVRVAIHLRDKRGVPLGPILVEAKPKRTTTGLFTQFRSWEIITADRVTLDVESVTVEVQAVAFVDG